MTGKPQLVMFLLVVAAVVAGFVVRALLRAACQGRRPAGLLSYFGVLMTAIADQMPVWFGLAGCFLFATNLELQEPYFSIVFRAIDAVLMLTLAVLLLRLTSAGLRLHEQRFGGDSTTSIVERLAQVVIVAVSGLMILRIVAPNVDLTPVITGLGLAGVATALALQDTLSNFFAGLYILADRPVRIGDFAKLENGEEGYVIEIGWRSTQFRTLANNVVAIPNQKLAQSVLVNYHMPDPRVAVFIPVTVPYGTDVDLVERELLAVANEAVGRLEGLLSTPAPLVRLSPGFGAWGLEFSLIVQAREYADQFRLAHELRKAIVRRFERQGIGFATQPGIIPTESREA